VAFHKIESETLS